MMDVGDTLKLALFIALGILSATFIFWWARSGRNQHVGEQLPHESGAARRFNACSIGGWLRHEFSRHTSGLFDK
jgi:hypothetical protein